VTTDACLGDIRHLEHVEAVVTLSASVRGQISIYLTSPSGTRSTLLLQRSSDRSGDGFNAWPFMTTHNWGESPLGMWRLEVRNGASVGTLFEDIHLYSVGTLG
jgi:subtilisin-like proprotein convertase family protein